LKSRSFPVTLLDQFPRFETIRLNEKIRSEQSGAYIDLPGGVTHYELSGPETGPLVALIHGFSIPYYLWDPTFKALTRAGIRVLRFDLFGRGYSDRPRGAYDLPFFSRQLSDLLAALGLAETPIQVAGVSMGGPICLQFALDHPGQVKSVCLIDPAGFPPPGLVDKRLLIPLLGELLFQLQSRAQVLESLKIDLFRPERFPEYIEQYFPQLRLRGTNAAVLATMRSGVLDRREDLYREFGRLGLPVQLFWGEDDRTFPFTISRQVLDLLPKAEFHLIVNARHVPHYEYPDLVNPAIIDFLKRHA
jgi:pimeloyl-ACP methyl ester carboxylesterase